MGEFLKNINWKHVLIMCIGNVFAGMGIGIFKLAGLGTDPFSGMNMAVADMIGMAYGNFQLIVNIVLLIIEIAFGRRFLGIGSEDLDGGASGEEGHHKIVGDFQAEGHFHIFFYAAKLVHYRT